MNQFLFNSGVKLNFHVSFTVKGFFGFLLMNLFVGCSNPMGSQSQFDAIHRPGFKEDYMTPPGRSAEIVSASSQSTYSKSGKFLYSGALASPTDLLIMKSASGRYLLYSNSQGEFLSSAKGGQ